MRKVISIIACISLLSSCERKELRKDEYLLFMSDERNGYIKHHKIGTHEYLVQLATPEFVACKEFDNNDGSAKKLQERIKELDSSISFIIKIKTISVEGDRAVRPQTLAEADQAVAYYGQQAMRDIYLLTGKQKLSPVAYEYENNYGLSPYNTIVVVFRTQTRFEDLTLTINDQYRNVYALSSEFTSELITNAPKLKLN